MTVTYPHDRPGPRSEAFEEPRDEPFVPVYARTGRHARRKGGVKTWMILAPVGVLTLGGLAAALMLGDGGEGAPAPLAEPAATGPVLPAQPLPVEASAVEIVETTPAVRPAAAPAPALAARRAAPAPARRAPQSARESAPAATPRVEVAPTAPEPYTATLNTAPTPAEAPPPVIVIQPAD